MSHDPQNQPVVGGETQVQQALRTSELIYRRLFEAAQEGIMILDVATGRITDVNPFVVRLLGFSHGEMVGKTVGELSPFKDVVSNQAMLERMQKEGYVRYDNLPLETRDGRKIAVEFVSNVYQAGDQKVIQCNIRDITQRKQAEEALQQSERSYREIFNAASDAIFIHDADTGAILDVNDSMLQLFGFSREEVSRLKPEESSLGTSPYSGAEAAQWMTKAVTEGPQVFEWHARKKSGELFWVEVALKDANLSGKRRLLAVVRDITQRKQAEESHARLATAVEQAAEAIVITDPQGIILYANPAFAKTTGYTVAEAIGLNPNVLKSGKHDAEFYRRLWATIQRGETWRGHFINQRKDGTLFDEDATISPVRDAGGNIVNYVAVKRDVTREMRLEARINQAQKMESIGQLAGGIAHDFNNILACIMGYLDLAKLAAAKNPDLQDYLEHIAKATDRAVDLVRQILTFSRQNKPERKPIKLNHVVLEALKLLRASLPANIRIITELTETPTVLADASAIHQVIMNLGTNAWHAMRDKPGTLKVEMGVLDVDENVVNKNPDLHPGRYVQLSVSDTGCGMDHATLEHIFEPFFTTKAQGEGTGLGLSVVHGIMKTHDGGISVYSELGVGTAFHLYFPVFTTEPVAAAIETKLIPRGHGERILLVDDEEALTQMGKQILDQLGYTVTTTNSVMAAVAIVRAQTKPFDLVITDLAMPIMDGIKLGGQLLKIQPDLPIILTTGFSGLITAEKLRALGFRELLNKPSTIRTLGETVHRVLHHPPAAD